MITRRSLLRRLPMVAVAAGASLVMVFCMATPGLAARVLMVSAPHISLGGGTVDLTNLAPGDNFVEPISVQNTGTVPMQLELTAATPSDVCGAPACVVGTDLKWLDFTVTDGSGNTVWTGSLADLESGVTLSPAVGPGTTADFSLSISLPLGTPDGGQGESLEFALSGTGVPLGPTTPVFVPTAPSSGGTGSGSGPTTGGSGQPPSPGGPHLSADQSATPPVVPAGGRAGFTLTLTNDGTAALGGVSVQDHLPGADSLAWSLLEPGEGSHLVSPEGCALIGLSLSCVDLSVPAQSSVSVAVISSPVPIDCSVSTISSTASIAVPGSPVATESATASLTCVQGESISRPSPSSPPPAAPKAPIVLSGQLPFTGSQLIWGAAVIALALGAVGAGLELAGRLLAGRRNESSSIG